MPICFSFQTNLNLFKMNLDRGATYLFPCCNQHQSCFFFKNLNPVYYRYISGINIHIHIYFRTFSLDHIFMFITHSQTNLTTHIKFLFFFSVCPVQHLLLGSLPCHHAKPAHRQSGGGVNCFLLSISRLPNNWTDKD